MGRQGCDVVAYSHRACKWTEQCVDEPQTLLRLLKLSASYPWSLTSVQASHSPLSRRRNTFWVGKKAVTYDMKIDMSSPYKGRSSLVIGILAKFVPPQTRLLVDNPLLNLNCSFPLAQEAARIEMEVGTKQERDLPSFSNHRAYGRRAGTPERSRAI